MIDVPVLVKDALRDGRHKKNYRFLVLNDDGTTDFTIDNNNLVSESVKFDERMCSGDTIKFGLCEGSSLEFQYFDKENIRGRRINALIDVDYKTKSKDFVETDSDTRHPTQITKNGSYTFKSKNNVATEIGINKGTTNRYFWLYAGNNYERTIDLTTEEKFWVEEINVVVTVTAPGGFPAVYTIPMGYFTVDKCPKQVSTGIHKVTAYNKLKSEYLDAKANDQIKDIIANNVIGGSDGVDIGTILDGLLGDYAIEHPKLNVDFTTSEVMPTSHTATIRETSYDGSSNGYYLHELAVTYYLTPNNFSTDNFYRFKLNTKNIYDAEYSYCESSMLEHWFKKTNNASIRDRLKIILAGEADPNLGVSMGGAQFNTSNGSKAYNVQDYRTVNNLETPWFTNITSGTGILCAMTGLFVFSNESTHTWTTEEKETARQRVQDILFTQNNLTMEISTRAQIEKKKITAAMAETLPDVTLRQLQAASFEVQCQFGQLNRVSDLFSGVELNNQRLLPASTLYPANTLYPGGVATDSDRSTYSKLWTDDQGEQSFRYLIVTYKEQGQNDQTSEQKLQRTVNANGTTDYVMSDNWLFKNLVWTANEVGGYADAMAAKLRNVSWVPFEMWAAGLPYIETGDEIEVTTKEGTYTSYILQRQLKGIQNLQDTFINGTLDVF